MSAGDEFIDDIKEDASKRMDGALEALRTAFSRIRTGRANAAILDGVQVDYYGTPTPVTRVATVTVEEALEGFRLLCRTEGIIPALESAHAIFHVSRMAADMAPDDIIVVCLSGRGDKDVPSIAEREGIGS